MGTEHFGQFFTPFPNFSISQSDSKCQSFRHWVQKSLAHLGQFARVEPRVTWQTVSQSGAGHHTWFLSKTTFRASKFVLCFSKWSWLAKSLMSSNLRTFLQASDGHLILTVFRDISDSIHVFRHCNSKKKGEDFQSITFLSFYLQFYRRRCHNVWFFPSLLVHIPINKWNKTDLEGNSQHFSKTPKVWKIDLMPYGDATNNLQ